MGTNAQNFFTPEEQQEITRAIRDAELDTSGEIRVHIENSFSGSSLDRAAYIFKKLGMDETKERNGVLIYLAVKNRSFAIIGDSGINAVVPADFWDEIKNSMVENFRQGRYSAGLTEAIRSAGQQLKSHFPRSKQDVNELSDEISYG